MRSNERKTLNFFHEQDSDPLKLFEKQLEAAMKSGSAKANFGAMISSETDSPARKKAKIDC